MGLKGQWKHHSKKMKILIAACVLAALFSALYLWGSWKADMKKVYIVQLSNAQEPVYPQACAICGMPASEPLVALSLDPEDARTNYMFYRRLKNNALQSRPFPGIPAHHACIRNVQYGLLTFFFLILAVGATIAAIGMVFGFGLFSSLIAAVILATPLFYFVFTKPLPVEYFFREKENLFSFTNRQYAEQFARLNHAGLREEDYRADSTRSFKSYKGMNKEHMNKE